ncbi:MAG TPA: Hsp20/alpha crystallin family protein [Chitinophagaceae bacterium]|jgi:HSP20 family protein|nr:Hsp20/alpha crystallin family protein [Chitinophagaceae bacterium]
MSVIKRENGHSGMPAFFNDLFTRDFWNWGLENFSGTQTTIPAVNIRETGEHFEVEVAAPGMQRDDFRIELDDTLLTISSNRRNEQEERDNGRTVRREFSYQSFQRSFRLPKEVVDADGISARYENGLLLLVIPKKEEVKQRPPRMIEIA